MNKGLNPFFLAFESHHINAGKIPTLAPANKGIYVRGEIATYWHVHPGDGGDKSPADPSTSAAQEQVLDTLEKQQPISSPLLPLRWRYRCYFKAPLNFKRPGRHTQPQTEKATGTRVGS